MKSSLFQKILFPMVGTLLLLVITLLFATDFTVGNRSFINGLYEKYDTYTAVGTSFEEITYASDTLIDYLYGKSDTPNVEIVVGGISRPFLNQKEIDHMVDVKGLFVFKTYAQWGSLLLFLLLIFLTEKGRRVALLMKTSICSMALLAIFGLLLWGVGFDTLFVLFHEISFNNDLWLLDPATDLLIRMVPGGYFFDILILILMMTVGSLAVIAIGSAIWKWRKPKYELRRSEKNH